MLATNGRENSTISGTGDSEWKWWPSGTILTGGELDYNKHSV